jgi:xylulose-5-phosphate/fructose-6-phosphate phosphoketolase
MPDFRKSAVKVDKPGATLAGNVPTLGEFLREVMRLNMTNFRVFGPDETQSNRLQASMKLPKRPGWESIFRRMPMVANFPHTAA